MRRADEGKLRTRPDIAELDRAVDDLVPILRRRSGEAERGRRCPPETVADYIDRKLLRVCQPAPFGGYEYGYDDLCRFVQKLARGCASQAWVYMVYADNALKLSAFSQQAQADVWSADPDAIISIAVAAVGFGEPVEGGVLWSGSHGFSSGVDHAKWVICGGAIKGRDRDRDKDRSCFVLIPKDEVQVLDDWDAIGLAGSGSNTFVVDRVFVPEHRILDKKSYDTGVALGSESYKGPVYRLPRGGVSAASYTAAAVGAAQGFLAEYVAQTRGRKSRGNKVADDPGIQASLAQASAEIEAAERLYMGALVETMRTLAAGEHVGREQQVHGKRNCCWAAQLAMSAVQRLFNDAGGRALYRSNDLQRYFRDTYAASAHHSLTWSSAAREYGKHLLTED
jgi:alkylation response protein AidB-like acyl-CoA dehydrogenase